MRRSELVGRLVQYADYLDETQARCAVDAFFDEIACSLERGERVELRGFGAFFTRNYGSRIGRNPKTGEKVQVKPKCAPLFRMGQSFQRQLIDRTDDVIEEEKREVA